MALASKVRIDYFFDVLSPYAWIGFEALSRYQTVWNIDVKWRPFFLFGVFKKAENVGQLLQAPGKMVYLSKDVPLLGAYYGIPVNNLSDPEDAIIKKGSLAALRFLTILTKEKGEMVAPAAREIWMRRWSRDEDIHQGEHLLQSGIAEILAKGSLTPLRFLTVLEMNAPNLMEPAIREAYCRRWIRNEDFHKNEHLAEVARKIGIPNKEAEDFVSRIEHPDTKARLMETSNEASATGAFGAPWINVHMPDGKMHSFWGSDRFHIIASLIGEKFPGHMREIAPKYE